ncbi:MAG: YitT family protein [Clostridia bacterium]|nr:YitT family protein [Clostridia bacterium]
MLKKWSRYKGYPLVRDYLMMLIGSVIAGSSYAHFFVPNNIAPGGITGVATVINYLTGWLPVGTLSFILNIPLFLVGYKTGGKRFVFRSFVAMMLLSLFIDVLPGEPVTRNSMLASIFGGILLGIGLGMILRAGATTGGTDLAAQMVHNRFSFISVGTFLFAIDCMVILLAGVVFDVQAALFALIALYISTKVIDTVIKGWNTEQQMMIISDHAQEIAQRIIQDMDRGATFLDARGAYTGEKRGMIYCVVTRSEIMQIKTIVAACDEHAFVTVSDAHEVMGEGFKQFGKKE